SPVYYAAIVLHPGLKRYCNNAWRDRPEWLISNERAFQRLWSIYKSQLPQRSSPQCMQQPVSTSTSNFTDYLRSLTSAEDDNDEVQQEEVDEYGRWKARRPVSMDDMAAKEPIRWWRLQRAEYPCLSQMAVDILTIPAAGTQIERAFSEAGD